MFSRHVTADISVQALLGQKDIFRFPHDPESYEPMVADCLV